MFTAALLHQPKSPTTYEWISPMWSTHTISCVSLPPRSRSSSTCQPSPQLPVSTEHFIPPYWILFSHKKERFANTCHNMEEPWKHKAKWKNTDTKTMSCMIPFIWNVQNRQIQRARKQMLPGDEKSEEGMLKEQGFVLGWRGCAGISSDDFTTLWINEKTLNHIVWKDGF